ncbi:M13 family metallopeptidase [Pseudoalteromonas sp. OOF1S-7]|uniref:M13 family metallopeptidase n=1 Tax=Pseudoalteromonas sp. OOF1S-7 TaxID=2917757 RepID=UPI001EF4AD2B|nr:M13 family metallopeptidase [Pseudoalteromonas sp. OOF1S-7]MCG7536637.1 M13 family metallopeptidase [Pseudoalteromonas sp. OOF1S-7]
MKKCTLVLAVSAALVVLGGCTQHGSSSDKSVYSQAQQSLKSGVELQNFDMNVRPQDDFYQHVNGKWLSTTAIPAERSSWGSFDRLRYESDEAVKALIQQAQQQSGAHGSSEQKIGDFYASFMNQQRVEQLGLKPLNPLLAEIDAVQSYDQLSTLIGKLTTLKVTTPLRLFAVPDGKNSSLTVLYLMQNGIGMPAIDYYLNEDEKTARTRHQYLQLVTALLHLSGEPQPQVRAQAVLELETKLAAVMLSRSQSRQLSLVYNPRTPDQLRTTLGKLNWEKAAQAMALPAMDKVILMQPDFFAGLGKLFTQVSVQDWQTYLRFHTLNHFAPQLSEPFVAAHFDFYKRTLRGVKKMEPRWQRGVGLISDTLGEEVGKLYVDAHFSLQAKAKMEEMVRNLIAAYRDSINELSWMSDATKAAAQEKLAKVRYKIGYPDVWRSYDFEIRQDDLIGNVMRAHQYNFKYEMAQINQRVDEHKWEMTPQTVNAYYHPLKNEIVFPAARLQPPSFDLSADDAVNYGAIGAVIGHELGHGFDDQGAQFDGDGNIRNWWAEPDLAEFKARGDALVAQFNRYRPFEDVAIDGRLTLGENIGDLGGVTLAYKAYMLSLAGKEKTVLDGYTPEQRFFIGFAQNWRTKKHEAALRQRLVTDVHAPEAFRANGPLSNFTPFYEAFSVKEGDKLYRPPTERVKIW